MKRRSTSDRGPQLIFQDQFESGDTTSWSSATGVAELPSGAVVWLWATTCPSGWSELLEARGRSVVGLPSGGTIGAVRGAALADLATPMHSHTASLDVNGSLSPDHGHWAFVFETNRSWRTFTENFSFLTMIDWDNGIDSSGSGVFPFASPPNNDLRQIHGTSHTGVHSHSGSTTDSVDQETGPLPYLQMKLCRKD